MKSYLILLFAFYFSYANCQPSISWSKTFGGPSDDDGLSMEKTPDGGVIAAGKTSSNSMNVSGNHGGGDMWVVKLNNVGIIEWQKCLGGSLGEIANSIKLTNDGGYVVSGFTNSNDGDVSGFHGTIYKDSWVVKLNSIGDIEWQKCLGGSLNDYSNDICQTNDGGYVLIGATGSNDGDVIGNDGISQDIWIVKLSSSGLLEWQKTYGGLYPDEGNSIKQTNDGGYIMIGTPGSNDGDVINNHGGTDIWLVKLNNNGLIEWQSCLGGSNEEKAYEIQLCTDGGYVISGSTKSTDGDVLGLHSGFGSTDFWIVKLNSSGTIEWQKCLGGSGIEKARSVEQSFDGGYIVAGESYSNTGDGDVSCHHGSTNYSDIWLAKLNSVGSTEWETCLGGSQNDYANSVRSFSDGSYAIFGGTESSDDDVIGHLGNYDFWLVKLNSEVGLNEINKQISPRVYPNPNDGQFTLECEEELIGHSYVITDQQGREVGQGIIEENKKILDIYVNDGIYFLKVDQVIIKLDVKK
jgi:hypothetical protein